MLNAISSLNYEFIPDFFLIIHLYKYRYAQFKLYTHINDLNWIFENFIIYKRDSKNKQICN